MWKQWQLKEWPRWSPGFFPVLPQWHKNSRNCISQESGIQLLAALEFLRSSISRDDFISEWLELLCDSFPSARSSWVQLLSKPCWTKSVQVLLAKTDLSTVPLNLEPGPAWSETRSGMQLGKVFLQQKCSTQDSGRSRSPTADSSSSLQAATAPRASQRWQKQRLAAG